MRITYPLFFLLWFPLAIQAQIPAGTVAPEDSGFNRIYFNRSIPKVTGKLLNMPANELKNLVITYTLVTPFSVSQISKTVSPKPDGSFSLVLDHSFPYQQIWIQVGDLFYAGLYVNKDLYLVLDMKKIKVKKEVDFNGDGVSYLGTDGPLNIYMNNYILYKRPEQLRLSQEINILTFSPDARTNNILPDYNLLCDSVKQIEDSYIENNPSKYSWILENERVSDYYAQLFLAYLGKTMDDSLWQKTKAHKSYLISNSSASFYKYMVMYIEAMPSSRVSASWKDVAKMTDLNADEKTIIDSLKNSEDMQPAYPYTPENIKNWVKQIQPRIQKISFIKLLDKSIRETDSMFSPSKADFLKLRMNESKDLTEQKIALKEILNSVHTAWCAAIIKNEYQSTSKKIDAINKALAGSSKIKGKASFGKPLLKTSFGAKLFKAPDINALDFLAKLKESFPGRAIIIDRWATWCGPCLAEMPHEKELQEASKDLPVVFIYLCTIKSSTESKWKSKVVELKQPGIHILIGEKLDAELIKIFFVQRLPGLCAY